MLAGGQTPGGFLYYMLAPVAGVGESPEAFSVLNRVLYVFAAFLLWLRLSGGSPSGRGTVVAALFIALDLAIVALFWRASTNDVLARGTRRALRLLGTTAAVALVGRTLALWVDLGGGSAAVISPADPFLLAIYPLTLVAFLSFPSGGRTTDHDGSSILVRAWRTHVRKRDQDVRTGRQAGCARALACAA